MSFKLVVTPNFDKEAKSLFKKYKSLKSDLSELFASLKENPFQGVSLGKDRFKIRMAITSKGKGKSAGARVITCIKVTSNTLYLLSIYDKSSREDITDKELMQLINYTL
jgi:mRNA-degrading endonuclease RelE of RelBE toxin-antitoxin system